MPISYRHRIHDMIITYVNICPYLYTYPTKTRIHTNISRGFIQNANDMRFGKRMQTLLTSIKISLEMQINPKHQVFMKYSLRNRNTKISLPSKFPNHQPFNTINLKWDHQTEGKSFIRHTASNIASKISCVASILLRFILSSINYCCTIIIDFWLCTTEVHKQPDYFYAVLLANVHTVVFLSGHTYFSGRSKKCPLCGIARVGLLCYWMRHAKPVTWSR